jgi:site-specific DNA-methyltransferase (adenine-specific)
MVDLGMKILGGDCLEVMGEFEDGRFSAIVTDPPYGLGFMGKEWDRDTPGLLFWQGTFRVLRPGGHALIFGGARTFHRLACAVEDAGFEIRDCLSWLYGQGFPKSKALLKPAWEPILLARKPGPLRQLNIDGCRIGSGRWPANVILDEEVGAMLDVQAPSTGQRAPLRDTMRSRPGYGRYGKTGPPRKAEPKDAIGGASRFFYCAKASKRDRGEDNTHPTVKPVELMRWLVRLVNEPGALILDPFAGSGTTGVACQLEGIPFVLIERELEYLDLIRRRLQ